MTSYPQILRSRRENAILMALLFNLPLTSSEVYEIARKTLDTNKSDIENKFTIEVFRPTFSRMHKKNLIRKVGVDTWTADFRQIIGYILDKIPTSRKLVETLMCVASYDIGDTHISKNYIDKGINLVVETKHLDFSYQYWLKKVTPEIRACFMDLRDDVKKFLCGSYFGIADNDRHYLSSVALEQFMLASDDIMKIGPYKWILTYESPKECGYYRSITPYDVAFYNMIRDYLFLIRSAVMNLSDYFSKTKNYMSEAILFQIVGNKLLGLFNDDKILHIEKFVDYLNLNDAPKDDSDRELFNQGQEIGVIPDTQNKLNSRYKYV